MSSMDARVMPFGKYKGERVDTVAADNPDWLRWALRDVDMGRWPGLYGYIREVLRRRGELNE